MLFCTAVNNLFRFMRARLKCVSYCCRCRIMILLLIVSGSVMLCLHTNSSLTFLKRSSAEADLVLNVFRQKMKTQQQGPADRAPILRVAERGETIQVAEATEVHVMSAVHRVYYPVTNAFNVLLVAWAEKSKGRSGGDGHNFVCCLSTSAAPLAANSSYFRQVSAQEVIVDNSEKVKMRYALYSCSVTADTSTNMMMNMEHSFQSGMERRRGRRLGGTEDETSPESTHYRTVAFAKESCDVGMTAVAHEISEPEKPREGEGGVAICAKVAYGELDPRLLVEWFELAKIVGVSVVQVFYHDVSDNVLAVFRYYEKTGFLLVAPITPAARTGDPPRHFTKPRDDTQAWADETVASNACLQRLGRYDYVVVMDFDELLLPSAPFTSLPQMLREAEKMFPKAGAFLIYSYIVMLDWDEVEPESPVHLLRHRRRSVSNDLDSHHLGKSSPKTIARPQVVARLSTHTANVQREVELPGSLYTFLHYRACKPKLWGNCTGMAAVEGTEVLSFRPQWLRALSQLPLQSMGCDQHYASTIALAASDGTKPTPASFIIVFITLLSLHLFFLPL